MRSQMELALTIGTVIIGAILIIVSLVISWQMIMPLTDAIRIAVGIGYDVSAIQAATFSVPGDIQVYYPPPSMCESMSEYTGHKTNGWICQSILGGNPNITSIGVDYKIGGGDTYGFWSSAPLYSQTDVGFSYIPTSESPSQQLAIGLPGFATFTPSLSSIGYYLGNNVTISKFMTPYGDDVTNTYKIDAIEDLINRGVMEACEDPKNYSVVEVVIPPNWALGYNMSTVGGSDSICEYRLVLNSEIPKYEIPFNLWELASVYGLGIYDFSKIKNVAGYNGITYGEGNAIFDVPYILLKNGNNVYDPFNQSNVMKYNTGWLKVRCYNLSKLGFNGIYLDDSSSASPCFDSDFDKIYSTGSYDYYMSKRFAGAPTHIYFNVSCTHYSHYNENVPADEVVDIKVVCGEE